MECFISCALYRADVIELFIEGRRVHSISRDLIDVFVIEVNGTQTNKKGLFYVNDCQSSDKYHLFLEILNVFF